MIYNWIITYLDTCDGQLKIQEVQCGFWDLPSHITNFGILDMNILSISKKVISMVTPEPMPVTYATDTTDISDPA